MALRLVDRYILKELVDYFLFGMVIFSLVAFFSDTLLDFIQDVYIPFGTLLTIIGLQLPKTLALVFPASTFLAVLMVYNQMNNHFEIISMRANGISLYRLVAPALILGVFSTICTYTLYDFVVPYCNKQTEVLKKEALSKGSLPFGRKSFMYPIYDGEHNLKQLIYIGSYSGHTLGDSTVIDLSKPGVMQVMQAKGGTWYEDKGWTFKNANAYVVSRNTDQSASSHLGEIDFNQLIQATDVEKQLELVRKKRQGIDIDSGTQSFWQMLKRIQTVEEHNRTAKNKWRVSKKTYINLWERWTLPLSCFVMLLSAVPLAITQPRSDNTRGFIFALMVLFLYYILRSASVALGQSKAFTLGGLIPLIPSLALAAWLPIIVLTAIGVGLLVRKTRVL